MHHLPLEPKTIKLAGEEIALYVPEIYAIKRRYAEQKEAGATEPFPYWAQVWPSAIAMASYIMKNNEVVKYKTVLELGAGLGLPSIIAARYARNVTCTDISGDAVEIAKATADHNRISNIEYRVIDWRTSCEGLNGDVLLLSDVNYEPPVFEPLYEVILQFLKGGATILLTTPHRLMAKPFIEKLLPFCSYKETIEVSTENDTSPILLLILKDE